MKAVFKAFVTAFLLMAACANSWAQDLRDGDIIFHTSRSEQSLAIQKATKSKYSHMGIVFFQKNKPFVYEAVNTVRFTPFSAWIARGAGGHYVVKRLRDVDKFLTPAAVAKLREAALKFEGRQYDPTFEWSDTKIYCSELVWKTYNRALGLEIGRLQKLGDFDLTDSIVKKKMTQRYGKNVPIHEPVISPAEMFSCPDLEVVVQR